MDHKCVPVTQELFKRHLRGEKGCIFVTKKDLPEKLKKIVKNITPGKNGALLITERLSPLAEQGVQRIAEKSGCRISCKQLSKRLGYIGSDFGGHYSTDFYEFLEYEQIRVTRRKPKGAKHEHS